MKYDTDQDGFSYIHASLDDYGLDPIPFRIACRLLRRAGADGCCFESTRGIAEGCNISWNTAQKWLDHLVSIRMFSAETRRGEATIYRPNPPSMWARQTENQRQDCLAAPAQPSNEAYPPAGPPTGGQPHPTTERVPAQPLKAPHPPAGTDPTQPLGTKVTPLSYSHKLPPEGTAQAPPSGQGDLFGGTEEAAGVKPVKRGHGAKASPLTQADFEAWIADLSQNSAYAKYDLVDCLARARAHYAERGWRFSKAGFLTFMDQRPSLMRKGPANPREAHDNFVSGVVDISNL